MHSKIVFTISAIFSAALTAPTTSAGSPSTVPKNVLDFYNKIKQGQCKQKIKSGYESWNGGPSDWSYCGDHLTDNGIVYIQGPGGEYPFTNMDINCDGQQKQPNDGRCGKNPTDQIVTATESDLAKYNIPGITDLDPYIHDYVVFGNSGTQGGNIPFNPRVYGIRALSILLVVTQNKMVCGIWGDTNGGERDASFVGEASLAMGELMFGSEVNGTESHVPNDVLYLAFAGPDAVPGKEGANWAAKTKEDFAKSIDAQCQTLIKRIGGTWSKDPTACDWFDHCLDDKCTADGECFGDLICKIPKGKKQGVCGEDCNWNGHCTGAPCGNDNDCGDGLSCKTGKCAA